MRAMHRFIDYIIMHIFIYDFYIFLSERKRERERKREKKKQKTKREGEREIENKQQHVISLFGVPPQG